MVLHDHGAGILGSRTHGIGKLRSSGHDERNPRNLTDESSLCRNRQEREAGKAQSYCLRSMKVEHRPHVWAIAIHSAVKQRLRRRCIGVITDRLALSL